MKETIKYFSAQEKESPIEVQMTGVSICDKSQRCLRTNPGITIIEYVFMGEGTLLFKGKTYKVKTDDVYVLPAGVSHEYYANPKNPWAKIFMNLSGSLARLLLVGFSLNDKPVIKAPSLKKHFKRIIKTSFADMPEIEKRNILINTYFEILHSLYQLNKESNVSTEAILLKNFLDENVNRIISNTELANTIYRSNDYCVKLFKKEFGTTPYDYQINNKINIARSLLQHTKMSISEIAEFVGYQNPQYFTSMFKTKLGITPTQYRKKTSEV